MEPPVTAQLPATRIVLTGVDAPARLATWGRRAVSIPVFFCAAALLLAGSPVLFSLALSADAVRRQRLATTRALAFFCLYFGCEVAGLFAATGIWLRCLGAPRAIFTAQNLRLQRWWTTTLRRGAFRIFSLETSVTGEEHCDRGPVIALFRHASVADTLLPMMLIGTPHAIALRWVLKVELLWDPCMDVVGSRLRNCFVSRMPETSRRDVHAVGDLMRDLGPRDGVVIYPEGTRFTAAKRRRLLEKLAESGDEDALASAASFEHVLPPRLGGALALLEANTAGADVLFCAHTGLESIATFADLWNGRVIGERVRIAVWRVPFESIPISRAERIDWLLAEWQKVDAFVAAQSTSRRASRSKSPPSMGATSRPRP